jgi:phosphoglycolate phosphatase-like HAD superfamily hydrolase
MREGAAPDVTRYRTMFFDCDGVLLNSNAAKSAAFYRILRPYGDAAAIAFLDYHQRNGGMSRFRKLDYFFSSILQREARPSEKETLLDKFAAEVEGELLSCAVAEGIGRLRELTASSRWIVVSGSEQSQLRRCLAARGLGHYFDGGIFGSPATKTEIVTRSIASAETPLPAVLLGDSRTDLEAARGVGLDFVFVAAWTESPDWQDWAQQYSLSVVGDLQALCQT